MVRRLLTLLSVLAPGATHGLEVAGLSLTTDVGPSIALGDQVEILKAALTASPPDYTAARAAYAAVMPNSSGLSLEAVIRCSARSVPDCSDNPFATYATYWASQDYMHAHVNPVLQMTDVWNLTDKAREELTLKSVVLQRMLMSVASHLKAVGLIPAALKT
mmetsp:Transcript_62835/g.147400  ORF Transcript_62835/g.147400 Transcript_62835/m.147400 type:complete len:161 (-) Transcript_62835:78-560(-)